MRASAPAKLNLYLDVLGRRADGYHELETLFVATDWGDDVVIREDPEAEPGDIRLGLSGPVDLPLTDDNLALRAARAVCAATGSDTPLAIELLKRVPPGQGLGGGSSDAGAVLRLLETLRPGVLSATALRDIALELGSDVPFFLESGSAVGRGRGEALEPVGDHPPFEAVLILPPLHASTAVVFQNLSARVRRAPPGGIGAALAALRAGRPDRLRRAHYNALAVPAIHAYPKLARFTSDVERRLGRAPCLSGSGAALYDLPDPGETERVLDALDGLPGTRQIVHF